MARLFDMIPTVIKIIEKHTESRFSVWQVVFERSPAAGDTGCLELFMDIVVEVKVSHSSHLPLKTLQACSPDIYGIKTEELWACGTDRLIFNTEAPCIMPRVSKSAGLISNVVSHQDNTHLPAVPQFTVQVKKLPRLWSLGETLQMAPLQMSTSKLPYISVAPWKQITATIWLKPNKVFWRIVFI